MLKVGFLCSSTREGFDEYQRDIEQILEDLFFFDNDLVVINGGYRGLMEVISRTAEQVRAKKDKKEPRAYHLNTFGILFDGYLQDPQNDDPARNINLPNPLNNFYISAASLGERAQNLIQLSDIIVALPGSSGTLHEILHCIEHIKYGRYYEHQADFKRLVLHKFWDVGRLQNLKQAGLITDEVYDQLFFWSRDKRAVLLENLDEIRQRNGRPKRDVPKIPSKLDIRNWDSHQDLPDDSEYHSFIRELNAYLQGDYQGEHNHVLGLDIVIVDTEKKEIIELITIGIADYLQVLSSFLESNSSILSNIEYLKDNPSTFICDDLSNIWLQARTTNLFKVDFTGKSKKAAHQDADSATFNDWKAYLQKKKLGKTVVWITLPALGNSYVISAFLSLDIFIPELSKPRIRSMLTAFLYNQTLTRLHYKLTQELRTEAFRAAISQVMARNMSHNIGSHVSYRATNLQIKRRVRELYPAIGDSRNFFSSVFTDWLDHFRDRLDKYGIDRNEYLSDFDLSPRSQMFYRDLVLPFCENTFVMDNIAAGEELHYVDVNTTKLKIKCRIDGEEIKAQYPDLAPMFQDIDSFDTISYPDNFPYLLKNKNFDDVAPDRDTLEAALSNKKIIGAQDVEICVHSAQALYSILENFIRNSAKHKPKDSASELTVFLDLRRKQGDEHYCLFIYDNTSKVPPKVLFNTSENNPPGIFQKIDQTLLDPQGKPRRANWGYADMKINSFLLWNDINDLDDPRLSENFKLVTINKDASKFTDVTEELISSLADNDVVRFGYKIRLSASRKILWIGDFDSEREAKFKTEGLVRLDSLRDSVHENEGLASFQFAVLRGHVDYAEFISIEEKLPGRVIVLDAGAQDLSLLKKPSVRRASDDDVHKDSMQDLLRWCWRQWLADPVDLHIYFENNEVAKTWSEVDLPERLKFTQVDKITRQKSLDASKINVIYNRHGGVFEGKGGKKAKLCLPTGPEEMNFATKHSIIFFDKGSEDFAQLYYPPTSSDEREMLIYELVDAATTNVFVVDERIADYAGNPRPKEFRTNGVEIGNESLREQNWNMYAAGKLFVVHEIINGQTACSIGKRRPEDEKLRLQLDAGDLKFSTSIRNLEAIGDDRKVRKDVLIIHRTYLDRDKIGMEPKEFLRLAKQKFGMVFITSGGGYPHSLNLDEKCRFISFSTLESYINSRLSKNRLNGILRTNIN